MELEKYTPPQPVVHQLTVVKEVNSEQSSHHEDKQSQQDSKSENSIYEQ